jgi:hypothetical protein
MWRLTNAGGYEEVVRWPTGGYGTVETTPYLA